MVLDELIIAEGERLFPPFLNEQKITAEKLDEYLIRFRCYAKVDGTIYSLVNAFVVIMSSPNSGSPEEYYLDLYKKAVLAGGKVDGEMKCCVIGCHEEATVGMGTLALCDEHWKKAVEKITQSKTVVFRIRKEYFDQIVSGEKTYELRALSDYWRTRLLKAGNPPTRALFICGKSTHLRQILGCFIFPAAKIHGRNISEQGRKDLDLDTHEGLCIVVKLGEEIKGEKR